MANSSLLKNGTKEKPGASNSFLVPSISGLLQRNEETEEKPVLYTSMSAHELSLGGTFCLELITYSFWKRLTEYKWFQL